MFNLKLDATPTYWWDVELLVPKADGEIAAHSIRVLFLRMLEDEFDAFQKEIREQSLGDREVARRVMRGLAGVVDEHGVEAAWGEETCAALLSVPGVASAIVGNWFASRDQAHLGNLKRLRERGPASATTKASATAPNS
jgi:hypothetical protein